MVAPSSSSSHRLGRPTRTGVACSPITATSDSVVDLYWIRHDPEPGGELRPLLLINGLGSPLVRFEDGLVAEFVDRGFSVARFDNRDVGRSSRVPEDRSAEGYRFSRPPYRLTDMARDAVAILDANGWDRSHVLGQSLGGMIAQQLAISHPDRLLSMTSLMSSTGNPDFGSATDEASEALLRPPPRDRDGWIEHTVTTGRIWATPDSWNADHARADAARLYDYGVDPDGTGRQFRALLTSGARDEELSRLDVATLVIHGSADTLVQPDGGRHTAEVIPGARYVELEGFGHDLPRSRWIVLADTLNDFVTDVEQST